MSSKPSQMSKNLHNHFEEMNFINIAIKTQLHYAKILLTAENQEQNDVIRFYELNVFSVCLWKCAILDIQKLYSNKKNDYYTFKKLFNKLNNKTKGDYKSLLEKQEFIPIFENKIQNLKSILEKTEYLRDKSYAHKENKFSPFDIDIDFIEVEKLSLLANEIIETLSYEIFGYKMNYDNVYNEESNIIKDLAEYTKAKQELLYEEFYRNRKPN